MSALSSKEIDLAMSEDEPQPRNRRGPRHIRRKQQQELQKRLEQESDEFKQTQEYLVLTHKSDINLIALQESANQERTRIMNAPKNQTPVAKAVSEVTSGESKVDPKPNTAADHSSSESDKVTISTLKDPDTTASVVELAKKVIDEAIDKMATKSIESFRFIDVLKKPAEDQNQVRSLIPGLFVHLNAREPERYQLREENGALLLMGGIDETPVSIMLSPVGRDRDFAGISVAVHGSESEISKKFRDIIETNNLRGKEFDLTIGDALEFLRHFN